MFPPSYRHWRILGLAFSLTVLLVVSSFGAECTNKLRDDREDPLSPYVIAAADDGSPMRPCAIYKGNNVVSARTFRMTEEETKRYLEVMIQRINTKAPRESDGRRKVLIFTHGGMNRRKGAIVRAAKIAKVLHEKNNEYYPISIAWNSEPFSCYGEHLLRVRQGQKRHIVYGLATSPFYFLADLARGLSRAPVLWARMAENALTQPAGLLKNSPRAQRYVYAHEVARYRKENSETETKAPEVTKYNIRQSDWRGGETIAPSVAHTIFFPTKTVGSLILDTMGTGAWDIMVRRAHELFDSPIRAKDFAEVASAPGGQDRTKSKDDSDRARIRKITRMVQNRKTHREMPAATRERIRREMKEILETPRPGRRPVDYHARSRAGFVELLLRRLEEEEKKRGQKYSITLVGHSMGAIVSNEMLKRHPKLSFDRIVYLAAACSVKEAQDSVVPYLRTRHEQGRPAHFYNLSLHPVAETSEALGGDPGLSLGGLGVTAAGVVLVPRGSLLEWLDDFFTKPVNMEERRLGKWTTAITSVETFPEDLRKYVHLKMFPVGIKETKDDGPIPQEHGNFADGEGKVRFWEPRFLAPSTEYKALLPPEDPPASIDVTPEVDDPVSDAGS
jgi:pimeloyl-ACP methyl ester carboxylesterase